MLLYGVVDKRGITALGAMVPAIEPVPTRIDTPVEAPAAQTTATTAAVGSETVDDDEVEVADGAALFPLRIALEADNAAKIRGNLRLAFQVPEVSGGPCGRTFEDAFILANQTFFGIAGATNDMLAKAAQDKAAKQKKSKFALTYAIKRKDWTIPRYIEEGVRWLAASNVALADPGVALAAEAEAANAVGTFIEKQISDRAK